jgi:hypothetical protein
VGFGANVAGVQFGSSGFSKTPLGKAMQETIDKCVATIADKLKNVPFEARIIKVSDDNNLLISGGGKTGISEGDVFTIYSVGESLVDPATGATRRRGGEEGQHQGHQGRGEICEGHIR